MREPIFIYIANFILKIPGCVTVNERMILKCTLGGKSDKCGLIKLVQTIENSGTFFTKDGEFLLQNFDDTSGRSVHHRDNYMTSTLDASTFPLISVDYGD